MKKENLAVIGSRMTCAGFGRFTVRLVKESFFEEFKEKVDKIIKQ
jgi:galactokinase